LIAAIISEEIGDGEETVTGVEYVPPGPEIEAATELGLKVRLCARTVSG